jgi:hypothetical protein
MKKGHPPCETLHIPAAAALAAQATADDPTEPDDSSGKFEFLYNNRDRLKKVKRFIIAVDNDAPGKHLADELVRRLSVVRRMHHPMGGVSAAILNSPKP